MIPVSEPNLLGNELKYVVDAVESTWISSMGKYIEAFEGSFGKYCGAKHALSVTNGTVALHLALVALGIKPGDEVIVPALTYIATANAVSYVGATPVFADSEEDTWNICARSVERLVTSKTRAIIPVHVYGHAYNWEALSAIAKKHNLFIIEDAAEAIGTEYRGKKAGTLGDVSTFSFYGNKTITTGEGGMITTADRRLADSIRLLKDQGMSLTKRYWFDEIGYNYRMTNLQAAIGCAQMENIDFFVNQKRQNAGFYNSMLSDKFVRPVEKDYCVNSYWMYSVLVPKGLDREKFMLKLDTEGVQTRPFFHLLNTLPPYRSHRAEVSEITASIAKRGLNLPSSTKLTESDIRKICDIVNKNVES